MKKLCFAIVVFLALFACSAPGGSFEPSALAGDLLDSGAFSDKLAQTDSQIGFYLYELSPDLAKEALFYFSSGATAEELAVFKARSNQDAESIAAAVRTRIAAQSVSFADYNPGEVPKLDSAVLKVSGVYVVFCVANDYSAASAVIDAYI